jgi:putative SOS response-associated peptidase YedK
MCGRYSLTTPTEALQRLFRFEGRPNLAPRYNIAPTQDAPVVRLRDGGPERELAMLRWGLIPAWAKDTTIGAKLINARTESAAEKPAFRAAFAHRRCLVLADGFYEWQVVDRTKQPWRVTLPDGGPFAFAGLWERWQGVEGVVLQTYTILTSDANPALAALHDRMPVILAPENHEIWLDPGAKRETLTALLGPYPADRLAWYRVSRRVNNVRNDDAACIAPLEETRLL